MYMTDKIAEYIRKEHMINAGEHICVGVSGGADSVCLFRILEHLRKSMGFTMSVVHIEHGIRGKESLSDMEFVKNLADAYQIPFFAYTFPVEQIAKEEGLSVEEAGRKVRYEAFAKEAEKYGKHQTVKTALAHHADDNAETILFHMCRGSGIEGLAGIRPVRDQIIRPLLCVARSEIEACLMEIGQEYRTDATNTDITYSRNRLRNCVMPELERINERAVSHINCLSEDIREVSDYLAEESKRILKERLCKEPSGSICFSLDSFDKNPLFLQRQVMLLLLAEISGSRKDLGREHAEALLKLSNNQVGKKVFLPYGILAEKTYGALLFTDKSAADQQKKEPVFLWQGIEMEEVLREINAKGETSGNLSVFDRNVCCRIFKRKKKDREIPKNQYTKWFDYDKIKNGLCFRGREPADYFITDGYGHKKKLKEYLINEKIPKAERENIPLLADGSHILWIIGYRISEYYKITEDTEYVLEVQFMEDVT